MNDSVQNRHLARWSGFLDNCREAASQAVPLLSSGHLTRINDILTNLMEAEQRTRPPK